MRQLLIIFSVQLLCASFAKGQQVDIVQGYYYKIIEKRVYPDTVALCVKYFDKLDNEIANYDPLNHRTEFMFYQNKHLVSLIELDGRDTVSITKFKFYGKSSIGNKYYTDSINRNELYLTQYLDSLCQKMTVLKWYFISKCDTSMAGTWINEYDSIAQKIKRYIKEDSGTKYTCFRYQNRNSDNSTIIEEYKNDSLVYETRIIETKSTKSTFTSDLTNGSKTKTIEHKDNSGFIYKKEFYGTIFYTCRIDDPRRHGQDKPIRGKPDKIHLFEKIYYR